MPTPNEILKRQIDKFDPLFYDNEEQLNGLLREALLAYQMKAGVKKTLTITQNDFLLKKKGALLKPKGILSILHAYDNCNRFLDCELIGDSVVINENPKAWPVRVIYYENIADMDYENDRIPVEHEDSIGRYLYTLIAIENCKRERAAREQAQLGFEGLKTVQEYEDEKKQLLEEMNETSHMPASLLI